MPDNYTPQFQHQDWRDNVDLVSAEDPLTGFNKRFRDLRQELETISRIIGQINSSLAPPTTTLTFAPSFSISGTNVTPWSLARGVAEKAATSTEAEGWLAVQLPEGSRIQSMTVIGDKSGSVGSFRVRLLRQALSGDEPTLIDVSLSTNPFPGVGTVAPPDNIVVNQNNKYIVSAKVSGADTGATIRILAIQFVCTQA